MAGQRDDNSKKKQISAMNNHPDQDQAVGYKILGLDGLAWARQKNFTVVVDPPRQSARRPRDRPLGFRLEEVPPTIKLYDRTKDEITLSEVEQIRL
jgi:hypothetical protein